MAELDDALRKVREARAWQPDAAPKLVETRLLSRRGRRGQAEVLLEQVARSEPANAEAWYYLALAAPPRLAREAARRLLALRPSLAPGSAKGRGRRGPPGAPR